MDKPQIWEMLTQVFREIFDDETLTICPETTAKDIEDWDSVTHIQLLVAVEGAFGIRINTGEVAGLANVGELFDLIVRRIGNKTSPL